MSITKKLLEVLNGKIEVESKVGIGSTFKIQIPIETSQKEFENFSDVINKILNSNNIGIKTIFLKSILKLPLRIKDLKEALIIGDSLTSDIQGGHNIGIDTCWYNPKNEENTTLLNPTYTIRNLHELENII